ncbi:unnamed protein product [Sphagnum jensenii]|uniref:Uncharacterized protein n=1 Tax=Sphagnum jensenii TaxID=128206 RepID=A0ABP0WW59_9BRYO
MHSFEANQLLLKLNCCKKGEWLLDLFLEFGMTNVLIMPIYCDNESYIKIAMNPIYHPKTKHFTIHLKHIQ